MKIHTVVCDIDGTLMPPDCGTLVDDVVKNALLSLQEAGIMVILASARIFQGVYPLGKQIHMDAYGGYLISSNGAYAYDMKRGQEIFIHGIQKADALKIQDRFLSAGLDFGIAQTDCMIASGFSKGFQLDHFNCDIDYLITHQSQEHIHTNITKCSASKDPEQIDFVFAGLKKEIEEQYPYRVVRSTPYFVDVIAKECGKANALKELSSTLALPLMHMAAIGDGDSDADLLRCCGIGATLENGSQLCKQNADFVVSSCEQFGCLEFFERIKKMNYEKK